MANRFPLTATKDPDFRIVLIGKSGSGKSATGNTLLQKNVFQTSSSASSVTSACQKETAEFEGRTLAVVDTPDLFDARKSAFELSKRVSDCISLSAPGTHVFLLVIQLKQIPEERVTNMNHYQSLFGEEVAHYTMVLFTHGDDLEADGVSAERIIDRSPSLSAIVRQCGGRYHVFNNRKKDPSQVRELLMKVNRMAGNSFFTNDIFQRAERAIREETEKIRRENPGIDPELARNLSERRNCFTQGAGSFGDRNGGGWQGGVFWAILALVVMTLARIILRI